MSLFGKKNVIKDSEILVEKRLEYKDGVFYLAPVYNSVMSKKYYKAIPADRVEKVDIYDERIEMAVTDTILLLLLDDEYVKVSCKPWMSKDNKPVTIKAAQNVARSAKMRIENFIK